MNEIELDYFKPRTTVGQCYKCKSCGLTLAIVVERCYCGQSRGFDISELTAKRWKRDWGILITMTNDRRIELYTQFFAQGLSAGEEKTIEENEKWLDELEEAIVITKSTHGGVSEANRKKKAALSKEDREKLLSRNPNATTSDALVQPKIRKARMTEADKLKDILAGVMDDEDANAALGKLNISPILKDAEKKAKTEGKPLDEGSFTFNKEKKVEVVIEKAIEKHQPKTNTTQESLLADLLEMVDLSSTDLARLIEKNNTAELLLSKTVHKLMPDKMLLLKSRIAELIQVGEERVRKEAEDRKLIEKALAEKEKTKAPAALTEAITTKDILVVDLTPKEEKPKLAWNPFQK